VRADRNGDVPRIQQRRLPQRTGDQTLMSVPASVTVTAPEVFFSMLPGMLGARDTRMQNFR
jgi:hypothetical protein